MKKLTTSTAPIWRRHLRHALVVFVLGTTITACGGGGDEEPGTAGVAAIVVGARVLAFVSVESAGTSCSSGGARIAAGVDGNDDGQLQAFEITSTQYACNGAIGPSGLRGATGSNGTPTLVLLQQEPPGPRCAAGGTAVIAGPDLNADGRLGLDEATSTSYVCSGGGGVDGATGPAGAAGATGPAGAAGATGPVGANGATGSAGTNGSNGLVAIVGETAGANCSHGGQRITSGVD
ncbi:MAG: hypothetical protein H7Y62_12600, partial [Hyphomicrobium sp.]|nr:hypothetical protein [Hyphomicrobium sp.]